MNRHSCAAALLTLSLVGASCHPGHPGHPGYVAGYYDIGGYARQHPARYKAEYVLHSRAPEGVSADAEPLDSDISSELLARQLKPGDLIGFAWGE